MQDVIRLSSVNPFSEKTSGMANDA